MALARLPRLRALVGADRLRAAAARLRGELVAELVEADLDPDHHLEVDLGDRSWVLFDAAEGTITQGGPRRLWDARVALYDRWNALGRPGRERFGLSVQGRGGLQEIWLDDPGSAERWPLPGLDRAPA